MNEFRRCLIEMDVAAVRKLWSAFPGEHQPASDNEALIALHNARTQARSIPNSLRVYSHSWLEERGLPSGLPEELKPDRAQIVEAVGVSVKAMSEASIPLARAIERAMSDAVAEAYADGNKDPAFVKARMQEARARIMAG